MTDIKKSMDAALLSIGFLMEMTERLHWRCGGGRGAWEGCLAAIVLAKEPGLKARRFMEALPAEKNFDCICMLNTMAHLGYYSDSVEIAAQYVETRLLPCLFVPKGREGAPQVIMSRSENSVTVYDGESHTMTEKNHDDPSLQVPGSAYFFLPYDHHRQRTSRFMREGFGRSWFGAVVQRFSGTIGQILVTCCVLNIFALIPALFVMVVYDRVISPMDMSGLMPLTIGAGLALMVEYILRNVRSHGLSWMTARLDNLVGGEIFSRLICLKPELIEQASVAAQVARMRTFESVREFFSSSVFLSFLEIPFVLIAVGVMAAIAGPLVFVPLIMVGFYVVIFLAIRHKVKAAIRLAAKASSARQQFAIETFEKLRFVRMNGLTESWGRKYSELNGREVLMNFHLAFLGTVAETLANAVTVIAAVLTIGYGAHLIWAGSMSTGALVACMILVWRILLPFYSLCTMIPRLEQLRNSILQVNALMELEIESETDTSAVLPMMKGHIIVENVSFGYEENRDPIIGGLSFEALPGNVVSVMGRNGTGKTTILKMIKSMYQPTAGTVRIDGFDIRQLNSLELRRQMAYVPQQPDFFPGTIAENLVIGNPMAADEEIEQALRLADAWDDLNALPDGLETMLGRNPFSSSLGARISLARAYLQSASVMLIDELPNAVLNGKAGENLKNYIEQHRGRKTFVIVSYRDDFIKMSDVSVHLRRNAEAWVKTGKDDVSTMSVKGVA